MNSNMVWAFGDSMTALFQDGVGSVKSYYGYLPKTTSEVIADYYNFDYKNLGKGGTGNNEIFESFLKIHNDVKKDDILIFGWTILLRYRLGALVTNEPTWRPIFSVGLQNTPEYACVDGTYVTKEVAEQILLNRDQFKTLYQNEVKKLKTSLENTEGIQRKGLVLSSLMKFKQICNHPDQFNGNVEFAEKDSGKLVSVLLHDWNSSADPKCQGCCFNTRGRLVSFIFI